MCNLNVELYPFRPSVHIFVHLGLFYGKAFIFDFQTPRNGEPFIFLGSFFQGVITHSS